jgi:hypothetical protein
MYIIYFGIFLLYYFVSNSKINDILYFVAFLMTRFSLCTIKHFIMLGENSLCILIRTKHQQVGGCTNNNGRRAT